MSALPTMEAVSIFAPTLTDRLNAVVKVATCQMIMACRALVRPSIVHLSAIAIIMWDWWLPDINECVDGTLDCQQVCNNTEGSYQCGCFDGYKLTSDRKTCKDKNECLLGTHDCQQICTNNVGSFSCDCNPGYQIASNGAACLGKR